MSYVIRHTDYIMCCFSGHEHTSCDTRVAMVSPDRKKWKKYRSRKDVHVAIWKIRTLRTSQMLDKTKWRHPLDSKWVVEKYVDNVSITSAQ